MKNFVEAGFKVPKFIKGLQVADQVVNQNHDGTSVNSGAEKK